MSFATCWSLARGPDVQISHIDQGPRKDNDLLLFSSYSENYGYNEGKERKEKEEGVILI